MTQCILICYVVALGMTYHPFLSVHSYKLQAGYKQNTCL